MIDEFKQKIAGEIAVSSDPGRIIRKWREEFGLSQHQLADAMDVSHSVISDYESGRRKSPGVTVVKKLVDALIELDVRNGSPIISKYNPDIKMDCIIAMSTARVGACILVHEDGSLAGVFTHGDFARAYQKDPACGAKPVRDIMTKNPVYVEADKLAIVAVKTLRDRRIDDLVVLDADNKPVGLIDTQDLVRLKLI